MNSKQRVLIFGAIGIFNTALDFFIYILLFYATDSIVIANVCATSVALVVSYLLNRRFTFGNKPRSRKQFSQFLAVTLFGVWVLQTAIIYALVPLTDSVVAATLGSSATTVAIALPKLIATVVSLTWNYVWYSKVVFKDTTN